MKMMNKPRRPKWRRRRPSPLPEADSASAAITPESISGHFRSRRRFAAVLILTSLTTLGWFAACGSGGSHLRASQFGRRRGQFDQTFQHSGRRLADVVRRRAVVVLRRPSAE